jgi:hypothetical protein
MTRKTRFKMMVPVILTVLMAWLNFSCSPGVGTVAPSGDCIVTAQAKAIRKNVTSYPYAVDVLIMGTEDIEGLPNPTKDSVGKIITAETRENLRALEPGEMLTANIKWEIDNARSAPVLYIYNVKEYR